MKRRQRWALITVGVAAVGMWAIGAMGADDTGSDTGDEYGARDVCEQFVEDRLVSPTSADFSRPNVTGSDGEWTVTGSVDADNRMGAAIRVDYECVVRHTGGDNYRLIQLDHSER